MALDPNDLRALSIMADEASEHLSLYGDPRTETASFDWGGLLTLLITILKDIAPLLANPPAKAGQAPD